MKVTSLKIPDLKIIEPCVHEDERGFFFESFNQKKFNLKIGRDVNFVQDNHSFSKKYVLRGLHYQKQPFEQGKLIRVLSGEIFDVAVDIREESPTYGQWISACLSSKNRKQLWIPEGFCHGFLTLSNFAEVLYKTTSFYNKDAEITFPYNSTKFSIDWPLTNNKIILSEKDNPINIKNNLQNI